MKMFVHAIRNKLYALSRMGGCLDNFLKFNILIYNMEKVLEVQ